ncbi:hypothetical protein ACLOJK_013085 [Asimina triloba]
MAIQTVDPTFMRLGCIPLVDLRFLTQSELNSLSLCCEHAFDIRSSDDIIDAKIDRSTFNESAGSRKQTFTRVLLSHHTSDLSRRRQRRPGLLPVAVQPQVPADDTDHRDNQQIIFFLRKLFAEQKKPFVEAWREKTGCSGGGGDGGPRRSADTTIVVYGRGGENDILNRNGVAVNVGALAESEDPFGQELRRQTEGLETEVQLLGFLNGLEGRWASRRRKRKIVDAAAFGDELPVGWKILLGIRRKEGRVWLYCRRYIRFSLFFSVSCSGINLLYLLSVPPFHIPVCLVHWAIGLPSTCPIAQLQMLKQFETCKEVSSYLLPCTTSPNPIQPISAGVNGSINGTCAIGSGSTPGPSLGDEISKKVPICYSAVPISSISPDQEKQVLFRVENPAKTQLREILGCTKCNLNFADKDACVQHLLSFHKRSAKRCRLGKSIGDGVIIRDGKYECQFCHKVFDERRRYNSHVGVHVRDFDKSLASLPDEIIVQTSVNSPSLLGMPVAVSEVDALIEMDNDEDSRPVTPVDKSGDYEQNSRPSPGKQDLGKDEASDYPQVDAYKSTQKTSVSKPVDGKDYCHLMNDDEVEVTVEPNNSISKVIVEPKNSTNDKFSDSATQLPSGEKTVDCDPCQEKEHFPSPMLDEIPDNEQICGVGALAPVTSTSNAYILNEVEKCDLEPGSGLGSSHSGCIKDVVMEITRTASEENTMQTLMADQPPSDCFASLGVVSEKREDLASFSERLENTSPFKELGLDDIDAPQTDFMIGEEATNLQEAPMDLAYGTSFGQDLGPSVQFEWEPVLPEVVVGGRITTNCVWCRTAFTFEGANRETDPGSVGYMCPTCKARISGQLNLLDDGLVMKSDKL